MKIVATILTLILCFILSACVMIPKSQTERTRVDTTIKVVTKTITDSAAYKLIDSLSKRQIKVDTPFVSVDTFSLVYQRGYWRSKAYDLRESLVSSQQQNESLLGALKSVKPSTQTTIEKQVPVMIPADDKTASLKVLAAAIVGFIMSMISKKKAS